MTKHMSCPLQLRSYFINSCHVWCLKLNAFHLVSTLQFIICLYISFVWLRSLVDLTLVALIRRMRPLAVSRCSYLYLRTVSLFRFDTLRFKSMVLAMCSNVQASPAQPHLCLVSQNVFHVVSALQFIVCLYISGFFFIDFLQNLRWQCLSYAVPCSFHQRLFTIILIPRARVLLVSTRNQDIWASPRFTDFTSNITNLIV